MYNQEEIQEKITYLQAYVYRWDEGYRTADNAAGILIFLGFLLRLPEFDYHLTNSLNTLLKRLQSDLACLCPLFRTFVVESHLFLKARELPLYNDVCAIEDYTCLRHDLQIGFNTLKLIASQVNFISSIFCDISRYLLFADSKLLFDFESVRVVRLYARNNLSTPNVGSDFWWLNEAESSVCWIPPALLAELMASYVDRMLEKDIARDLKHHCVQCDSCGRLLKLLVH